MPFDIVQAIDVMSRPPLFQPTVKGWNRLEARPRTTQFGRALRAEVRDALWFLTRQWQFGEFQGEDAGSPVEVRSAIRCTPLRHYAPRGGAALPYDASIPLEGTVERETLTPDLLTHVHVTRALFTRLRAEPDFATIRTRYLDAYPLADASFRNLPEDPAAAQILLLGSANLLDGALLLAEVADGTHAGKVDGFAGLSAAVRGRIKTAAAQVAQDFARLYLQPAPGVASAWKPSYLEYQFACAAEAQAQPQTVLAAEQYASGRLDWYSFDVDARRDAVLRGDGGDVGELPLAEAAPLSSLPAPIEFGGMPSHRYWEMENRRIEFADIDAQTRDIARMLLTEFALVYGNDWCVIPHEVEVGSICDVLGIIITDTFGERILLRAAGQGIDDDWQRWTMFTLSTNRPDGSADTRLFVPPVLPTGMESAPLEKVLLLRDEMANMAWAVERTVQTRVGTGADGYEVARAHAPEPTPPVLHPTVAPVRYVLGTHVPENWRPLIPVHVPGSNRTIRLQRARMPGPARELRGRILDEPTPYYLNEEEVPRSGRSVTRAVQRVRWTGGRTFVWIGRRVLTGRGEASSGLAFDQVQPVPDGERSSTDDE